MDIPKRLPILRFLVKIKVLRLSRCGHFFLPNLRNPIAYPFTALCFAAVLIGSTIRGAYEAMWDTLIDTIEWLQTK